MQVQVQMACANSKYCIFMSFHPETKSANYFLIKRHSLLWSVIKLITDSILNKKPITEWTFHENEVLSTLEKHNFSRIPSFNSIRPLRTYIKVESTKANQLQFA